MNSSTNFFSVHLSLIPLPHKPPPRTSLLPTDTTDLSESRLVLFTSLGQDATSWLLLQCLLNPTLVGPTADLRALNPASLLFHQESQGCRQNPLYTRSSSETMRGLLFLACGCSALQCPPRVLSREAGQSPLCPA